jgi:hypothetical protein
MSEPYSTPAQGVTIGTFARVGNGGQFVADGATVHLGPNGRVGKWFDVKDAGSFVSARNFTIDAITGQSLPELSGPAQLGLEVAAGLIVFVIVALVPKLHRWLGSQIGRVLFFGVPPSRPRKVRRRKLA